MMLEHACVRFLKKTYKILSNYFSNQRYEGKVENLCKGVIT